MILPAFGVWPMLEYELDIIQRQLDKGNEVIWLTCDGNAPFCSANLKLKKRICAECKSRTKAGIDWLNKNNQLSIGNIYNLNPHRKRLAEEWVKDAKFNNYQNLPSLPKELVDADWYDASFSTLQTTYKELRPDIVKYDQVFQQLVLDYFQSYLAFKANLSHYRPDDVWIFNGRITRYRPALRISKKESKKTFIYEYPYQGFKRYLVIDGQYPHDFGYRSKLWKENFDKYPLPLHKKIKIGDIWYQKRLAKLKINYEKVFSKWQEPGLLPENWKLSRCNVVIFNSSEWESAGVAESRRWNYKDQCSAIEQIVLDTQHIGDIHFTLRIHPHMTISDKKSAEDFQKLRRFSNITVLSPESKYDTHALVMASDVVLTFYSLVGVESAWLEKKVICLGPAPYQDFGCVYLPRTHSELIDTLVNLESMESKFPTKAERKRGAQEFAFIRLFSGTRPKYFIKKNYSHALMRKNKELKKIKASCMIRTINRLLSLPQYVIEAIIRICNDSFLRREIIENPSHAIKKFFHERINGLIP